jgi:hypothetical protein
MANGVADGLPVGLGVALRGGGDDLVAAGVSFSASTSDRASGGEPSSPLVTNQTAAMTATAATAHGNHRSGDRPGSSG